MSSLNNCYINKNIKINYTNKRIPNQKKRVKRITAENCKTTEVKIHFDWFAIFLCILIASFVQGTLLKIIVFLLTLYIIGRIKLNYEKKNGRRDPILNIIFNRMR